MRDEIRFIDLFAGLGGLRLGFEMAAKSLGLASRCVFTSEIKPHAIETYLANFPGETIAGDITKVVAAEIPDFDVLLAGFPCQPFSSAGKGLGFVDTRGTLFFDIERILLDKKPKAFILENVEGLVLHDRIDRSKSIGRTLETILEHLRALGYAVSWQVLDASEYGLPQKRKRIYIVGLMSSDIVDLANIPKSFSPLKAVLEDKYSENLKVRGPISDKLLAYSNHQALKGKQVRDKRGGGNNIHSWQLGLKGPTSHSQQALLNHLLKIRRRKCWAAIKDIPWSDGMPLTAKDIHSTLAGELLAWYPNVHSVEVDMQKLVEMGYVAWEAPKKAPHSEPGYNIITGKLSFEISMILDPEKPTPTLVATDVTRLAVPIGADGFRRLSVREGLRLFGFPDSYSIPSTISYAKAFDLLGNSVTLNVVTGVSKELIRAMS